MKKLLLTILAVSFAGLAYSAEASLQCQYLDGKITDTGFKVKSSNYILKPAINFIEPTENVQYDSPNTKCGFVDPYSEATGAIVASEGNMRYYIYPAVLKTADWASYINAVLPGTIGAKVLFRTVPYFVSTQGDFGQYLADFKRNTITISDQGDSNTDIHEKILNNEAPVSFDDAKTKLKKWLMEDKAYQLDEKSAEMLSTFVTRYDNQAGLYSLADFINNVGFISNSIMIRGGWASVLNVDIVSISKNKNNVQVYLNYKKHYDGYIINNTVYTSTADVVLQVPITISSEKNGQLTLQFDKNIIKQYKVSSNDPVMKGLIFNLLSGYQAIPKNIKKNNDIWIRK